MTSLTKTGLTVYMIYPHNRSSLDTQPQKKKAKLECFCSPRWIWPHKQRSYGRAEMRGGRILRRDGWENESSWEHFYCTVHVLGDNNDRFRGICCKRPNTVCARVGKKHRGIHKNDPIKWSLCSSQNASFLPFLSAPLSFSVLYSLTPWKSRFSVALPNRA